MPGGDQTGPLGQGPMTGRGLGYCAGYNRPGYANPGPRGFFGRGFGFSRGFGRGFGWRRFAFGAPIAQVYPQPIYQPVTEPVYPAPTQPVYPTQPQQPTKEQEVTMLENDAKAIEAEQTTLNQELEAIKKRIEELKK